MAQTARVQPLPDSGRSGPDEGAWIHELTPTLSDISMFDDEGCVRPLATLPSAPQSRRPIEPLRLVVGKSDDRPARKSSRSRSTWR